MESERNNPNVKRLEAAQGSLVQDLSENRFSYGYTQRSYDTDEDIVTAFTIDGEEVKLERNTVHISDMYEMEMLLQSEEEEKEADDEGHYAPFREDLQDLINRHCMENKSDTPDFLLATFLTGQLQLFDQMMEMRAQWYNGNKHGGMHVVGLTTLDSPLPPEDN